MRFGINLEQTAENKKKQDIGKRIVSFYNKYGIYIILVSILASSAIISPVFLSSINVINVLSQIAVTTIIGCGMTFILISEMADLSAGSVAALAGCVCVGTYKSLMTNGINIPLSFILAILLAILISIIVYLVASIIITIFNAPSFIVTLATSLASRGMVYLYTDGQPIYDVGEIAIMGQGRIGIVPFPVVLMMIILLISWILLNHTRFGRYIYAIGGNREAAVASGIRVERTFILAFIIHGVFVGIAGILFMTRMSSGQPAEGVGLEFDAITSAIIGGTSFSGGIGTIPGTLAGSIIIGVINNILNLKFVQVYWQRIIKGLIIVVAVVLDILTKGGKKR